jgi:hypothetical protein
MMVMIGQDDDDDDGRYRITGCLLVCLVTLAFWVGVAWLSF